MFHYSTCRSPLGDLTLASDGRNLVGLWKEGQKYHGGSLPEKLAARDSREGTAEDIRDTADGAGLVFGATRDWLESYFAGKAPNPSQLPLAPAGGGAFRQSVWSILLSIPYGQVVTYGQIAGILAARTGKSAPSALGARAVGGAVGHNPISIIIPCHRVIGARGNLTGYAGGLATKERLLRLEGVEMSGLFMPRPKPESRCG